MPTNISNAWCGCTRPINKIHENKKPVINSSGWYLISTDKRCKKIEEIIHEYKENTGYEIEIHGYAYYYKNRLGKYESFVSGDWIPVFIDVIMNPNLAYWIYVRRYYLPDPGSILTLECVQSTVDNVGHVVDLNLLASDNIPSSYKLMSVQFCFDESIIDGNYEWIGTEFLQDSWISNISQSGSISNDYNPSNTLSIGDVENISERSILLFRITNLQISQNSIDLNSGCSNGILINNSNSNSQVAVFDISTNSVYTFRNSKDSTRRLKILYA